MYIHVCIGTFVYVHVSACVCYVCLCLKLKELGTRDKEQHMGTKVILVHNFLKAPLSEMGFLDKEMAMILRTRD